MFDVAQEKVNDLGFGEKMIICNLRDQDFFYDVIAPQNEYLHAMKEKQSDTTELPAISEPENM